VQRLSIVQDLLARADYNIVKRIERMAWTFNEYRRYTREILNPP